MTPEMIAAVGRTLAELPREGWTMQQADDYLLGHYGMQLERANHCRVKGQDDYLLGHYGMQLERANHCRVKGQ
jgi:hypothetical protein